MKHGEEFMAWFENKRTQDLANVKASLVESSQTLGRQSLLFVLADKKIVLCSLLGLRFKSSRLPMHSQKPNSMPRYPFWHVST